MTATEEKIASGIDAHPRLAKGAAIVAEDSENRCPRCGRELAQGEQGLYCRHCGYDFSVSPEELAAGGYFTGSECGVLGLIAGVEVGVARGLAAGGGEPAAGLVAGMAAGVGLAAAVLSGWLGNRLAAGVRRSFRRLLLSACGAGMLTFLLAAGGLLSIDALLLVEVGSTVAVYLTVSYATGRLER